MRMCPLPPRAAGGKPRVKVVVTTMLDSGQWVPEAIITFVLRVRAAGNAGRRDWVSSLVSVAESPIWL